MAIRPSAPRGARVISVRGAYIAPGFIDLHVWGDPVAVSRDSVKGGATAFLAALGPEPPPQLIADVAVRAQARRLEGAACLGLHLEGPFLNPARAGALAKRWMRRPTVQEVGRLARAAAGRLKLITIAPELPGAMAAIRRCATRGIAVSLGHSEADGRTAVQAVAAGARAVTHVFNGMRPFHHRAFALVDAALTDPRLVAMVIADGLHVDRAALRLLLRAKGPRGIALVTDSVRHQRGAWSLRAQAGAYYTPRGTLAGSALTMIRAVRNMVELAGASLEDAVRMASDIPARLIGAAPERGTLAAGRRADLVAFDRRFRVRLVVVGGRVVKET